MKVVAVVCSVVVVLVVAAVTWVVTRDETGRQRDGTTAAQEPGPPTSEVDQATPSTGPDDGSARIRGTIRWSEDGRVQFEGTLEDVCPRDDRRASVYVNGQNDNGIVNSTEAVAGPRCTGRPRPVAWRAGGFDVVSVRLCEVAPDGTEDPCVTQGYRPG